MKGVERDRRGCPVNSLVYGEEVGEAWGLAINGDWLAGWLEGF
jgi:hypothetical protein